MSLSHLKLGLKVSQQGLTPQLRSTFPFETGGPHLLPAGLLLYRLIKKTHMTERICYK